MNIQILFCLMKAVSSVKLIPVIEAVWKEKLIQMDNIYQSIKAFLKSFLNLFLAVVDLFTSLINGVASILVKLRPRISEKYTELKKESGNINISGNLKAAKGKGYNLEFKGYEESIVEEIRSELKQKVTSKEKYYYLNACVASSGNGFYAIVLSIFVFALAGTVMLYSTSSYGEVRILAAVIMAVLCAVACIAIAKYQKKVVRNNLVKQILDQEFADKSWEEVDKADINNEEDEVTNASDQAGEGVPEIDEIKVPEEKEEKREIAKIQPINVVGKEEIG